MIVQYLKISSTHKSISISLFIQNGIGFYIGLVENILISTLNIKVNYLREC